MTQILKTRPKRRDKLSIIAQILEVAKEGTLKTPIMYKANLSFTQLREYLDFLTTSNLIEQTSVEGKDLYMITQKGIDFLQKHGELIRLLRERQVKRVIPP